MKRTILVILATMMAIGGFAQKQAKFTAEDFKQLYNTVQGDYVMPVNDSTTATVHITPIWESQRFQWLYVEASMENRVVLQKVLEIEPKSDKVFKMIIHDLKDSGQFAGKWANRNFFDGFTKSILGSSSKLTFVKTKDFSYQMNGFKRIKALECFPKGDILHIKFVQEDERFYIKRMPKGTNQILGYEGLKKQTD